MAQQNVVQLRPLEEPREWETARRTALEVRRQLSLLQGYADLMDGLSPRQSIQVLKVISDKISDLTVALRPFTSDRKVLPPQVEDYRAVRVRQRQLLADYRLLLDRLRENLPDPQSGAGRQTTGNRSSQSDRAG